MRLVGVHEDVAITVPPRCRRHDYFLMPAVLAADRIGLHRKDQVLMDTRILPVNSGRISIVTCKRMNAMDLTHPPLSRLNLRQLDESG